MRAHGPQAEKKGGGEREGERQRDGDRIELGNMSRIKNPRFWSPGE